MAKKRTFKTIFFNFEICYSGSMTKFFPSDLNKVIKELGKEALLQNLDRMLLIRNFETRAEAAYLQGKVGGFFHSYIGQEAIQTAAIAACGAKNWWVASYRCHALALLLGATPNEVMAELYGKETGNAKGRGGSMHLYTERLLGGFGIVAGQIPCAIGAAFAIKYKKIKDEIALCFFGDGAVAQGAFHESLNLAALWDLPALFVIENNRWGMGTAVERAISVPRLAEDKAASFGIKGYTFDGMDFFNCYAGFKHVYQEILQTSRPVLVEVICERFKGHSVSDPGLYRSKESLAEVKTHDPIPRYEQALIDAKIIDAEAIKERDKAFRQQAMASMEFAEKSPWPDVATLQTGVFAKESD
jgi:pyruvate dehydrogenase E1 component alpha subunit